VPGLQDAFERIGEAAERQLPLTHAPGLALAVTDGEAILGACVRGLADVDRGTPIAPHTRFQIASMSKSFAGLVTMQEVANGTLDLAAPIGDALPWLAMPQPFGPVTLHHLMTHTGGLVTGSDVSPWGIADAVALRDEPPVWAPGTRAHYSNVGWKLVGLALEGATGTPIAELLEERVLRPLGMRDSDGGLYERQRADSATGYMPMLSDRPAHLAQPLASAIWQTSITADGSIVSTVADMCAYLRLVLTGGAPLLDPGSFDAWVGPHVEADEPGARYGYGWMVSEVDGLRTIWHTGTNIGFNGLMAVRPDRGLGVVVLLNGWGERRALAWYALDAVAAALAGEPLPGVPVFPAADAIADAAALEGTYVGEGRTFRVRPDGDGALLEAGPLGVRLERLDEALIAPHPALDRYPIVPERVDGVVVALGHGPTRYVRDGVEPLEPAAPPTWSKLAGAYRGDNPWWPLLRVYVRGGRLLLQAPIDGGSEDELHPLGDGSFAIGEADSPERLRFDMEVDGRTQRLSSSGTSWYRSFES
jgi:CubicO group peptidase (beta-lactamase class C family)